jgi:hypothetical protein
MIDIGLMVSMVLVVAVPVFYERLRPISRAEPSLRFVDAATGAAVAGLVTGRLAALALDDPPSILRFPDLLIIRSGVEFWPGVLVAVVLVAVGAHRGAVDPWWRLGTLVVPSMLAYGIYDVTCVIRGGCYGPASELGLRPAGASSAMVPVGLLMGLVVIFGARLLRRMIDRGTEWPTICLGALAVVAVVRAIGSIWLPRLGDGFTRPHWTSIAVAVVACIALGTVMSIRHRQDEVER